MRLSSSVAICLWAAASGVGAAPDLPPRTINDVVARLRAVTSGGDEVARARQLLDIPLPGDANPKELSKLRHQRGRAAEMLGLTDRYLEEYRAAWNLAKAWGGDIDASLVVELTAAEAHSGNILAAVERQEEGANSAPTPGRRLGHHAFLAENKARWGDLDGARRHLKQAEGLLFQLRDSPVWAIWRLPWEANLERARGGVAMGSGMYADAEVHFRKAAELREQDLPVNLDRLDRRIETLPQRIMVGLMLINRKAQADMLLAQGALLEAEVLYRETLRRAQTEFGTISPLALVYTNGLTQVLLEQGRLADAEQLAQEVIHILTRHGAAPEARILINARRDLAAVRVLQGHWQDALGEYTEIERALARDRELQSRLAAGDEDWALALVRVGRISEAVQMMERLAAGRAARLGEGDRSLASARAFLGLALDAAGRPLEALANYRLALPILLSVPAEVGDGNIAAHRRLVTVIEAYLDLLYQLRRDNAVPQGLDAVAESFLAADVARASSVQRALAASAARASIRDPQLATLARQEQDLGHRIATLKETLARLQSVTGEARLERIIADIRRDLPRLAAEGQTLRERIARDHPDYAQLMAPKAMKPDAAQGLLQADEALVAIYVGDRRSYIWAMRASGRPAFAAAELGREEVAQRVARLRRALDLGNGNALSDSAFDLASAHLLYRQLMEPVAAGFAGARNLLIVTNGALGQLPFSLLPVRPSTLASGPIEFEGYRRVPWLIRETAVTHLPAVSTLAALRQAARPVDADRAALLAFADPHFSARQTTALATDSSSGRRSPTVRNGPGPRDAHSASIADLAPLPDTAAEVREIAIALKGDPKLSIRVGSAASETSVKETDLARYRVIAFATHGLVPGDLSGLTQPALALSNPELTGEHDVDGLLTMGEILGLRMNADWVVLSACNTAAADGAGGEAVSGLGRAFFYAGTRALLVSHWPVETVSARLITTELFRRQAEQPHLTRAEALRQAMLAVMEKNAIDSVSGNPDYAYAHPLFWAPFTLVGDGGVAPR